MKNLIPEHLAAVQECLELSEQALQCYLAEQPEAFDRKQRQLRSRIEQTAGLWGEIREDLQSGAFLPMLRSDIYHLMVIDRRIAGRIESFGAFLAHQRPVIPLQFHQPVSEIVRLVLAYSLALQQAVEDYFHASCKIHELHTRIRQLDELNETIGRRVSSLTRAIYASPLNPVDKLHLGKLSEAICDISRTVQELAQALESLALKSAG